LTLFWRFFDAFSRDLQRKRYPYSRMSIDIISYHVLTFPNPNTFVTTASSE
jgi:hypothetical protein